MADLLKRKLKTRTIHEKYKVLKEIDRVVSWFRVKELKHPGVDTGYFRHKYNDFRHTNLGVPETTTERNSSLFTKSAT